MLEKRALWVVLMVAAMMGGCSKEALLRSELEDPQDRRETILLTLKIFDEHPEYVDELFELARGHEKTFERLIMQAALALEDPAFAASAARQLAKHPTAVERITQAMLVEARTSPELRRALAAAILAEGEVMNQIVTENPQLMRQVLMRTFGGGSPPPAPVPPPEATVPPTP